MSVTNKVFYHGAGPGIGDLMNALNDAGIEFAIKSLQDEGFAVQGAKLAESSGLDHTIILRFPGNDIPDHRIHPEDAARNLWAEIENITNGFSSEIEPYKHMIYIEPINEFRTKYDPSDPNYQNMHPVEWLGQFGIFMSQNIINAGWKSAMFGMNAGTPEPGDWLLPGMEEFLQYASDNRDKVAITLHEAKLYTILPDGSSINYLDPVEQFVPFLVGRFQYLVDAFRAIGKQPCDIIMSEWAFDWNVMPSKSQAMSEIRWLMTNVYNSRYVRSVHLWNLQPHSGNKLSAPLSGMIPDITQMSINERFPDDPSDPIGPVEPDPSDEIFLFEPYVTRHLLHPRELTERQRDIINSYLRGALPDGQTVGFAGWTHQDPIERLHQSVIIQQQTDSKLYVFDGHQIGTGLDQQWIEDNYPWLLPNVQFIYSDPPTLPVNIIDAVDSLPKHPTKTYDSRSVSDVTTLTVHHTAGSNSSDPAIVEAIANYHINSNDWPGIGYHFVILENGTIYQTNRLDTVSYHSAYDNHFSVGIALTGNFTNQHPTELQKDALRNLIWVYLLDVIPTVTEIRPHRGMPHSETVCPGDTYLEWLPQIAGQYFKDKQGYTGPQVSFVSGIDQPASDWNWAAVAPLFYETKLSPKFHAIGDSYQWYEDYKHPEFNIVRADIAPSFTGTPQDMLNEMLPKIQQFWEQGVINFIVFNEPNVEGLGNRWQNGSEFGTQFRQIVSGLKIAFPGIRIWHPPMSPSGISIPGDQFLQDAINAGSTSDVYGMTCHAYTGFVDNEETAANDVINQVKRFQSLYSLDRPLVIGEFSVNRPALPSYKSNVYLRIYTALKGLPGIQGAYSFTSSWYPNPDHNQEGWKEHGIRVFYDDIYA